MYICGDNNIRRAPPGKGSLLGYLDWVYVEEAEEIGERICPLKSSMRTLGCPKYPSSHKSLPMVLHKSGKMA